MVTTRATAGAGAAWLWLALCGGAADARAAADDAAHGGYYVQAPVVAVAPRYRWHTVSEPVERCVQPPRSYAGSSYGRYDDPRHHGDTSARRFHGYHEDRHRRDERPERGAGTAAGLVGGLIGGLIGHQFGGGNGKTALTIAGAALGASVAREGVRRRADEAARDRAYFHGSAAPARQCSLVERTRRVRSVDGYQVTYRYQGATFDKWLDHHPGNSVPVHVAVEPW